MPAQRGRLCWCTPLPQTLAAGKPLAATRGADAAAHARALCIFPLFQQVLPENIEHRRAPGKGRLQLL